ncbi:MAG: ADOP family duplicated permease [Gemmatimonadales bacterium]
MSLGERFRSLFARRAAGTHVTRAVDEELTFHIDTRTQRLTEQGLDPEAARAEALRQFGNLSDVRESCVTLDDERERAIDRSELVSQIGDDLRYAWRALMKAPALTAVAVTTIGVAIALLTTVFSIVNAGFLKPLPYPDPDRIVGVNAVIRGHSVWWNAVPLDIANLVRRDTRSFERVAVYKGWNWARVTDRAGTADFMTTPVDTATLALVGGATERGRLFTDGEITSDAPVALISDSLWRTRYGNDEAILGTPITVDKESRTIVGVMSRGFRFSDHSDIWIPLTEHADTLPPNKSDWYWIAARLKPGVTVRDAAREVDRIGLNLRAAEPALYKGLSLALQPAIVNRSNPASYSMAALFCLVALAVFAIACTNVGNLLLVRAAERRGEMAVRASLGASRVRLLRLSMAESVLLAAAAALLGTVLSVVLLRVLLASFPTHGFPNWLRFDLDWRVLAFVSCMTLASVFAFGLMPAKHGARVNLLDALRAASEISVNDAGVTSRSRRGAIVQLALSMALLVASLFFVRSYQFLTHLDHGYNADRMAKMQVRLDPSDHRTPEEVLGIYDRLRQRLVGDGRIEESALAGTMTQLRFPPDASAKAAADSVKTQYGIFLPGQTDAADRAVQPMGQRMAVSDEYFHLLRIPIVRGRGFGSRDGPAGERVAVVSERIATLLWGQEDPLGRTINLGPDGPSFTVIGVARDVRDPVATRTGTSTAAWPHVYFSARQVIYYPMLYFRARVSPASAQPAFENALRDVDPQSMVGAILPFETLHGEAEGIATIFGSAIGAMAIGGALLALLGVYGVIAYGVACRQREIGLRIALGARTGEVVAMFVKGGGRIAAYGLLFGAAAAIAISRLTSRWVWGTSALDPVPYLVGAAGLGAVTLFACWLAAKRAAQVEPLEALRSL